MQELAQAVDLSVKYQNPKQNILALFKKHDKDRKGAIAKEAFYDVLAQCGTKLKPRDQDLLDKALIDRKGNMDIVKFFYLSKGISEKDNVKLCGSNEIIAIIDDSS